MEIKRPRVNGDYIFCAPSDPTMHYPRGCELGQGTVIFMEPMDCDKERYPGGIPPIWSEYMKIVEEEEG